jgi:hypothetical protein
MIYLASLTEEIEDKLEGYYFIHTKEELDKFVINNKVSNRVVIKADFARKFFTPSGLVKYVEDAKRVNVNLVIDIDTRVDTLTSTRFIRKLLKARNTDEFMYLMVKYPKEFIDTVHQCCGDMSALNNEVLASANSVSRLQSIIDTLNKELENKKYELELECMNKLRVQSKLDSLVKRINYQYDIKVDQKRLFHVDGNRFDKVLYFKEITRVQYTDTFIYYLKEICRVLYNMPTRVVCIEGYYADGKIPLYPDLVPHHKLREQDVISGDILMLGMQPKIMTDILKNPSNISILIILDRGGYTSPHISGDNVEYFYLASDVKDVSGNVPPARIISYGKETLYIPYIEHFEDLDKSERMAKYSSLDIMKKIISLIEGR